VPATTPVAQGSRYRVQPGDSLSAIVRRLDNPAASSSGAMAAILDANPGAFINGDPDRLKAGSWLDIPSFTAGVAAAVTPAAKPQDEVASVSEVPDSATAYQGAEVLEPDARRQIPASEFLPDVTETAEPDAIDAAPEATEADATEAVADVPAAAEADYSAAYSDLVAGDVIVEEPATADAAPVEPAAAPARVVNPAAGTRIVGTPEPAGFSWNWLIWAAVALITAFGSYLIFWPKLRERFGSRPVGDDERVPPRTEHVAPISVPESEMTVQEIVPTYDNVDFDLSDDSPTEENLTLDADLVEGTGFDDSEDADVNRDFGFAATMDLDMELPETTATEDSTPETDIIPPPERPEDLVVSSEVLPEEDEDEYDISMVVDATKMPDPAEVTERDLRAVPIDDTGQTPINDDYTIVDEIGQDILEKDYEDEMSATQLLHAEIDQAASELAESIGENDPTEVASLDEDDDVDDNAGRIVGSEDDTSIEMQLTNLSELDLTATLEAQNDDDSDGDDLDVTASIEADDKTVEMPRDKDGARAR
jgi:murein DD-endopeptidase MepM/ murein hydrolase activator NlpD